MTNNIPVNGWPQLKDLEAVQPTLDRLDKIEAWKRTVKEETFTGEDITIENALAPPARSLITSINAIQDLHGYDHPWAGGAEKNKLAMTVSNLKAWNTDGTWAGNVYTVNNTTIEILTDAANNVTGVKTSTGTGGASDLIMFKLSDNTLSVKAGDIITGCPTGGATNKYMLNVLGTPFSDMGSGGTSATDITGRVLNLDIFAGTELSNAIWYPMIRDASAPSGFAPYSNICPISGRTEARVDTENEDSSESAYAVIQLGTTVYGADINWDTGVMTVTTAILVKNTADMDNSEDYPGWKESGIRALVGGGINRIITGINTNCGTAYGVNTTGVSGDTVLLPKDYYGGKTQTEWIALAMDIQIPVTLATPTTIQLTPTQLQMLKGYNRVTLADGYGTIELKALTGANWS